MYNRQLDTFLCVSQEKSFSKAARRLFISPAAVIQQINNLEEDLKVHLFTRTSHGVVLTEAGEYLQTEASRLIAQSNQIRRELLDIETRGKCIVVGSSINEKVRLLYDLWVLFSGEPKSSQYSVRLVKIETNQNILENAEIVEAVNDHAPWQKDWKFFKICDVPMGCAAAKDHPLASRKQFTMQDLNGRNVVVVRRSAQQCFAAKEQMLKDAGAKIIVRDNFGGSVVWECSCNKYLLLAPVCWSDILFDMDIKPVQWDFTVPYGIFYKNQLPEPAEKFIQFIQKVYSERNDIGVVPVL